MNELMINGTQSFMEKEIPVVLGGVGGGKRCMSDRTVAEIHGIPMPKIRERIQTNISRFKENIDFIDLKQRILAADTSEDQHMHEAHTLELLQKLGYAKQSITQAEHIYLLSERGYEHIKPIRDEIYRLLEHRMGVALNIRLMNKKKTMSLNGVSKSKIDKISHLDVIADDKKLIEGYIAIVKEVAVKYGVSMNEDINCI